MITSIQTLRASAALEVATTQYGVYESAKVESETTDVTSNKLVDDTQDFTALGIGVNDIVYNITSGKYALVTAVDSATVLSVSADIMTDEDEYAIYPNLGLKLQQAFNELILTLDVTAASTDVGDTLDVYVDTSFDGGATFVNIGHFTQVLGNGGAKKFIMAIKNDNPGATAVFDVSADAAAGATRQIGFGDRIRYRATMVDADADGGFTFSLKAFLK